MPDFPWDSPPDQDSGSDRSTGGLSHASNITEYSLDNLTDLQRRQVFLNVLGNTSQDVGTQGRLVRSLPKSHPVFQDWYATNIDENPRGKPTAVGGTPVTFLSPTSISNNWNKHPKIYYRISFANRNYSTRKDADVPNIFGLFTDTNGNNKNYTAAAEWCRYCEVDATAREDLVTATINASMYLRGINLPALAPQDFTAFAGMPFVNLKNADIRMIWHAVPEYYVTDNNSYLNNFRSRINFTPFFQTNLFAVGNPPPTYRWKAGELLYRGYTYKRYRPAIPPTDVLINQGATPDDNLIDITLDFLETKRTICLTDNLPIVPNANFIQAGHNLQPWWADRKFHYATTSVAGGEVPSWLSFPFDLLFTNPRLQQAVAFNTD